MWFYILLLWTVAAVQATETCRTRYHSEMDVPECTDICLTGHRTQDYCAGNFIGFCEAKTDINVWFSTYMGCIITNCVDDADIYRFMLTFHNDCEDRYNGPLTSIEGDANEYLQWALKEQSTSASAEGLTESSYAATTTEVSSYTSLLAESTGDGEAESMTDQPPDSSSQQSPETPFRLTASSSPAVPSSTPRGQISSTTMQVENLRPGAGSPPTTTANINGATSNKFDIIHTHDNLAITKQFPTSTNAAESALSTPVIAGIAAGGTVAIALVIGLVFFFLRRHKRRASLASSADIWEPSRNTGPKPKLPVIENDSSFGRYSEVGAGTPMRQRSKAELHSESAPLPPPPLRHQIAHNGYPNPPEMHGGSGNQSSRYYHPVQQPQLRRHGSNMESRYPEMGSHATESMPSQTAFPT
ncbi:hypothetical protein G6011_03576 [Alternaria panax]|uniref:Extracellular membrane protein CFEM domain-containing protein n=1 Tax=Alternaria panax TaxID=48097 RepID=A0AAD4IEZ7_9PLEO|nr:hypothetical protein G6011_03576 [Alternaria panax]